METVRFKCNKCEVVSDLSESNSCLNDSDIFCVLCPKCNHKMNDKFNTLPKQLMEQVIKSWKTSLSCKKCDKIKYYSLKDFYYKKNADKIYFKCTDPTCGKNNRLKTQIPTAIQSTIKGGTLVSYYQKHKDKPKQKLKPITDDYNKDYKKGFEAGRVGSGSYGYNSSYNRGYNAGRSSRSSDFSKGALTGGLIVGAAAGGCSIQ